MASSSAGPLNIYRNDYEIELQMRQIQQEKGDCLTQGHISILPERVHLDLQQNDFTEMVGIWEQWRRAHRDNFQNKYGHIAWLLYVPVDDQMLRAIVQFWDPSYRCFVFNKVDMTPTIEEYSSLLRIDHMQPDKIYWRAQKTGHRRKLAKLLGMTTVEVDQHLKKKGDTECLPWSFLNGYIKKHMEDEQGLLAFAMAIYGLVVFPKVLGHVEVEWPDYKRKEEWVARLRRLMSIEVTWRAPWMPRIQVMYKCGDKPWVPLMRPWGAISYAPIMVRRQFGSEQFVPMTHQLDQLEFTYGEPETLKRIEEIVQDWKKTCRVDQGRVTDEVTTGYHTWHDQRVKNVIHPPKNPSKHPVNPEPQDVLLESELTRKRLEKEMMNMKRRHEDELEEVKKETARKVRVALKERDEWQSKFEEVSVANSSLLARIQELQSANNALQHEVRRQGQTIQELKNDCDMLETAMEGYKAQYEAIRQEYFQMRERNNSCTQSLQRKEAEMQWILRQMREVAFRARVMADKTEELRREILPKDELNKGKKAAGSSGTPEDVQQTETNTDPVYPPGFTPPPARNASIPMPSVGQYPFFGMPIGPPPTYAQQRPIGGASPSDPISLQPHNKQHLQTTILPESTHPMKIKPLTIFYEPKGEFVEDKTHAKMIIEVPKPFPYKDNKAVPWNYNCNVQVSEAKKWIAESQDDAANITGVRGITRSGRCYSPEAFENLKNEKGKEKEQSPREEKELHFFLMKNSLSLPTMPSFPFCQKRRYEYIALHLP
ncbi:Uncharacterized protein TCM_017392 [Theobroma cacao]|uniref:DUF7745 domain-containing protein n=1 Tax=Theobroma cacao TaxID=3641 RepID=A0A061EDD9_THECC|nr:Uncharacterized protein TCM_017392 [Theobroma cacao]